MKELARGFGRLFRRANFRNRHIIHGQHLRRFAASVLPSQSKAAPREATRARYDWRLRRGHSVLTDARDLRIANAVLGTSHEFRALRHGWSDPGQPHGKRRANVGGRLCLNFPAVRPNYFAGDVETEADARRCRMLA